MKCRKCNTVNPPGCSKCLCCGAPITIDGKRAKKTEKPTNDIEIEMFERYKTNDISFDEDEFNDDNVKKKHPLIRIIGLIYFVVVIIIILAVGTSITNGFKASMNKDTIELFPSGAEKGWYGFELDINDAIISLPYKCENFMLETGTVILEADSPELEPMSYAEVAFCRDDGNWNDQIIYGELYNNSSEIQPLNQCDVVYVSQNMDYVNTADDIIIFPGGFAPGNIVTEEELLQNYGETEYITRYEDGSVEYIWFEPDTANYCIIFVHDDIIKQISVKNIHETEESVQEVDEEESTEGLDNNMLLKTEDTSGIEIEKDTQRLSDMLSSIFSDEEDDDIPQPGAP